MKKIFLLVAGTSLLVASCTTKSGDDATAKNLEVARKVSNAFTTGDTTGIRDVVADDFVDHGMRGETNRDSLMLMIRMAKEANMKMETVRELADGDYVYQWIRFSGISDGKEMPAGPFDFTEIEAIRFKDGKCVEHWAFMEPRDMMKMMPAPPSMDTTTKNK
jgi:predicted SnoaL-like aldol condensation-catalyzing enzyme